MKKLSSEIEELLAVMISQDRDELYGTNRLSSLSFGSEPKFREPFEVMLNLLSELSDCSLDRIPPDQLTELKNHLVEINNRFAKATKLQLEDANPKAQRDAIVNELESLYPQSYRLIAPIIAFANKAGTDFKRIEKQAHDVLQETKAYTEKAKEGLEAEKKQAQEIIAAMRSTAAESGVSQNSIHYSDAAKAHERLAANWLKWTIGFGAGMAAFTLICLGILIFIHGADSKFEFTYLELAMTIIFVLAGFALNFTVKQYSTHRHIAVINGDKAKALATFLAFVKATENEEVKDAVLQQASSAAFTITPSGYLKGQPLLAPPVMSMAQRIAERGFSGPSGHA
jgi:hypothetical protein